MKPGQYGRHISFIDDKIEKAFLIQLIGEDDENYIFKIDTGHNAKLVYSKNCFPVHEWTSGDGEITRKTVIEMYESFTNGDAIRFTT